LILEGLNIFELGAGSIAGGSRPWYWRRRGAHVTKLEPPDGDLLGRENTSGFLAWNRGKSSAPVVCAQRSAAETAPTLGELVMYVLIGSGRRRHPVTTDSGLIFLSHGEATVQLLQPFSRSAQEPRGGCPALQVEGAEVSLLCSGGIGSRLITEHWLLGTHQP
jgi:hypothetical protein